MTKIKESLQNFNPWWKNEFKAEFKEREIYPKIKKYLPLKQIIAFTGLRRVGKTTLMQKIVEDKIQTGFNPQNVIFFSFDEFRDIEIKKVLSEYEELLEKDIKKEKYLLLFDEIQKVKDWESQIKTIYDIWKNLKIIISGSESLFIKKGSKETLAGRIFEFKIETLSFKEFLSFRKIKFTPIKLYEKELSKLFKEFTLTLGFPELVNIKDKEIINKYVKESLIEKIIYKDIQQLFKIRDVSLIESLLNIFLEEPGQIVDYTKLSKELNITRQTLSAYLSFLEKSFLIKKLYNFSKNQRKIERKLKKYYSTLISVDLLFKEDPHSKSKVFEWLLVNQLKSEFFWRDSFKNEVDIILTDNKITPLEIKYGKIDTKGILVFMKKYKIKEGYILTPNQRNKHKINSQTINIVPAFEFLLQH